MKKKLTIQNYNLIDNKNQNQSWKGNNKFLFNKNIYIGPQYYYGIMSCMAIIFYSALFYIFILLVSLTIYNIEIKYSFIQICRPNN